MLKNGREIWSELVRVSNWLSPFRNSETLCLEIMAKGLGHAEFQAFKPYDFAAANKDYVTNKFQKQKMIVGARSRVGIITCCDARCSPDQFFNMEQNEAFVIRNGGGRTASLDVLRTIASIEISSDIKELKVVHHTGEFF